MRWFVLPLAALALVACTPTDPPESTTTTTTTVSTTTTTTTTTPPSTTTTTTPPSGTHPTEATTGPTVANPQHLGNIVVREADTRVIDQAIVSRLEVHPGGTIIATNVRVEGAVVVVPRPGQAITKLHLDNVAVTNGMTVNVTSGSGLYWGSAVPVDIRVRDSWIRHPQGSGSDHTQALAGFGWPTGATFEHTTFRLQGPMNGTGTAPVFWHGRDTVFDDCYFGYERGVGSYYTVYVRGVNNVVRNSSFEKGAASYIYPNSSHPMASYVGNVDATTGAPVAP